MRPVFEIGDEPRAYRIIEDVSRDLSTALIAPEDSIEEALLPQALAGTLNVLITGGLLESLDERDEVRRRSTPSDQRVNVIRHDRVREEFEVLKVGRLIEVLSDHTSKVAEEGVIARPGHDDDVICIGAAVVEPLESRAPVATQASGGPSVEVRSGVRRAGRT
jgi:hypothetical protein